MVDAYFLTAVLLAAFIPPILFLIYVRVQEKTNREPVGGIFSVFFFAAIFSVLIALVLEYAFHPGAREYELLEGQLAVPGIVLLVVVVAPLVEEFAKGIGVRTARRMIIEPEDGIVYGAAAGFGFSATENLFYELSAYQEEGQEALIAVAVVRTITGCFLHATASGILGYGMARMYIGKRGIGEVLPYFALAVLLHAAFNLVSVLNFVAGVGITVLIAIIGMRYTVQKIRRLDAMPGFIAEAGPPR